MRKHVYKILALVLFCCFGAISVEAQCPSGQFQVTVDITTDDWGYECYWELTPVGNACGMGTLTSFGNNLVGCGGGGAQVADATDPGAYPNNTTVTEIAGCFTPGTQLTLHYVDDWGDGGADFEIFVSGISVGTYSGADDGGSFDFVVTPPPLYDAYFSSTTNLNNEYTMVPIFEVQAANMLAEVSNQGTNDITNVEVTFEIFDESGTAVFSETSAAIATLASGASQLVSASSSYTPSGLGEYAPVYTVTLTEADGNTTNNVVFGDTLMVTDSTMARDNGIQLGSLGIGTGIEGILGQTFTVSNDDVDVNSVTYYLVGPTAGDVIEVSLYDFLGAPTTELAKSEAYTITPADANGVWITSAFNPPVTVSAGTFYLGVNEPTANNLTLGTSEDIFTPGAGWVDFPGNPQGGWANSEAYGFEVIYMLRANLEYIPPAPTAGFVAVVNDSVLTVSNQSTGTVDSVVWDFGDGTTSNVYDPEAHTYSASGDYNVCLTVFNPGGSDTYCDTVSISIISGIEVEAAILLGALEIFPNPVSEVLNLEITLEDAQDLTIQLIDAKGAVVNTRNIVGATSNTISIDVKDLAAGSYNLNVTGETANVSKRVMIQSK